MRRIFLSVNNLILRHDIKLNNKHDFKLVFRWDQFFKILKIDSIKKTYVLKKLNETCFDETYTENWLKCFRIWNMQVENAEEKKLDLTLIQKNVEKFEKRIKTAEKNLKQNFKILKKKSN